MALYTSVQAVFWSSLPNLVGFGRHYSLVVPSGDDRKH